MSARTILAALAMLTAAACGAPPSFSTEIQPIFNRSCAIGGSTCHGATGTGAGLRLDSANAYANIVGVTSFEIPMPLVTAGNPDSSFLLHKVRGSMYTEIPACSSASQNCGVVMPMVGGIMLSADEIDLIRRWIAAGAPNN